MKRNFFRVEYFGTILSILLLKGGFLSSRHAKELESLNLSINHRSGINFVCESRIPSIPIRARNRSTGLEPPSRSSVYVFISYMGRKVRFPICMEKGWKAEPAAAVVETRHERSTRVCDADVKKWGLIVHLWRRESALASISRGPLFPLSLSFSLSLPLFKLFVNFWLQNGMKRSEKGKDNGWQAPLTASRSFFH